MIDIIIVLYNSASCIDQCLFSIKRATDRPYKVWLVENCPKDGSVEAALQAEPNAVVIRPGKNLGFGAAINLALAHSTSPYILLLNPDAHLEYQSLDRLIETLETNPCAAASGALVLRIDDGKIDTAGMEIVVTGWARDRGRGQIAEMAPDSGEVEALSGGVLLLRRASLAEANRHPNAFWGELFLYNEDVELSLALRRNGWKLLFVQSARAFHVVGGAGGSRRLMRAYCARNRIMTMLVHATKCDILSFKFYLQWARRILLDAPQLMDNLRLAHLRADLLPLIRQVPAMRERLGDEKPIR